jgi:hypothetical protein
MSLTKVSYSMINGSPVNVMDFGAACDWNGTSGTDDTAAIQAAIDFCITNKRDMVIPGLSRITASLNINRAVDSAAADNFFTISSDNGGGLVVTTAINMFSSSLPYVAAGVTQLVKFENLIFETNDSALSAYVLDGNKYIRTQFVGCSFRKIKCLTVTGAGKLTQSIYFFNCQGRRWAGTFFGSLFTSFDIKVHGCLFEAGGECFKLVSAVGCSFVQNTIEGMSGGPIVVNGSQGLTIQGNYFEGSPLDIDLTLGGHLGVNVLSNYFGGTVPSGAEAVFWEVAENSNSLGNYSAQKLHRFTGNSKVVVNDYAVTAVSNLSNQTILPYNIPVLSIYQNLNQSVTTATPTKVTFDTGTFDTAGGWIGGSYRFLPLISGYYQINTKVYFGNATLTSAYVSLYKNASEYQRLNSWQGSVSSPIILNGSCLVFLNGSTDYIEIWGYAVGTTLTFGVASSPSEASRFEAVLVRV